MDRSQYRGLEGFGEACMHGTGLLAFTFHCLEIVKTAFAGDLALELLEPIEGHASSIRPIRER